jgi:hypothetical protein
MRKLQLKYDKRVKLNKTQVKAIEQNVIERIYSDGKNALGQQTAHAIKGNPRDLYRVQTDILRKSTKVTNDGNGTLTLSFGRDDIILATLDERYGFTFLWSAEDIEFVDSITKAAAIRQGLPPLEEDIKALDTLTTKRNEQQTAQRDALISDMNKAKRANKDQKLPQTIIDKAAESGQSKSGSVVRFELDYNQNKVKGVRLTTQDLINITAEIKRRIREKKLNVNGSIISPNIIPFLDNLTINSIKVVKKNNSNNKLVMQVTYFNKELPLIESTKSRIFGWGFSDIDFVNQIVSRQIRQNT